LHTSLWKFKSGQTIVAIRETAKKFIVSESDRLEIG
jgi:hypothetical protein